MSDALSTKSRPLSDDDFFVPLDPKFEALEAGQITIHQYLELVNQDYEAALNAPTRLDPLLRRLDIGTRIMFVWAWPIFYVFFGIYCLATPPNAGIGWLSLITSLVIEVGAQFVTNRDA